MTDDHPLAPPPIEPLSEAAWARGDVGQWPTYRAQVFRAAGPGPWAAPSADPKVMASVSGALKAVPA